MLASKIRRFPSPSLFQSLSKQFSLVTKPPRRIKNRTVALFHVQQVLTDYLHSTRCLPFAYAEQISKNAPIFVSNLLSKISCSDLTVSTNLRKFLCYNPINEFEVFFESIGLKPVEIRDLLPPHEFFLSENGDLSASLCALFEFGFPWNLLGQLYKGEISIFGNGSRVLKSRLRGFEELGFSKVSVIGICLAFPFILGRSELEGKVNDLFDYLKGVLLEGSLMGPATESVEMCYQICRKIRVFYDLGCEKENLKEGADTIQKIFLELSEEILVKKVEFFCSFGAEKRDVGLFILQCPEVLNFDLENPVITVSDYLEHIGLCEKELKGIVRCYPHVFGRNRLANLPQLMKALNLHDWFIGKIMGGDHHLLIVSSDDKLNKEVLDNSERIEFGNKHHAIHKLDFFLGIGFGDNKHTLEILQFAHGTKGKLQQRFNALLRMGISFAELCKMISAAPKILNQSTDMIEQKVNFICNDLHFSLRDLYIFPAYLCYDLEKRIKPRYRIITWLRENDVLQKDYSISTIIATSENKFISCLLTIHPAAPKQWLECFSFKGHDY